VHDRHAARGAAALGLEGAGRGEADGAAVAVAVGHDEGCVTEERDLLLIRWVWTMQWGERVLLGQSQ
jgi:hypothetical protein